MSNTWPWQPIETAPKNGADILVCCGPSFDPMFAVVNWSEEIETGRSGWMIWWAYPAKFADWAEFWQPIADVPLQDAGR